MDKDEVLWLKALVWAYQLVRFTIMDEALKLSDLKTIKFIQADMIVDFEQAVTKWYRLMDKVSISY